MTAHPHTELVAAIRLALGREPDVVLWPLTQGVASARAGHMRWYGLVKGASDLLGVGPRGKLIALECKTGNAVPTPEQRRFLAAVTRHGGIAAIVHSVAEARSVLDAARREG